MKKSNILFRVLITMVTLFILSSISFADFTVPNPTVDYTIVFRLIDPHGDVIDLNRVGYRIEGDYTYLDAKPGEEPLRRYGDEKLLLIERIDNEMVFKYRENSKLAYNFYADFGDYMFSLNGEITPQQLKNNGNKDFVVELKLNNQNKFQVTSTVDGKFYENSTVMFSSLKAPKNTNLERNTSAIGIINPITKMKVVYLSSGIYTPIFSAEDDGELILYEGWRFEANKKTPKLLKFNKKKVDCVQQTIVVEEKLAQKPYYAISFYNVSERYSYFGEWNRNKIKVYFPNKNIYNKAFTLSDQPNSVYSHSINYDFEKNLSIGDLFYSNAIDCINDDENDYYFSIKSKDFKGNFHERSTSYDFNVYKMIGLDEASKNINIKNFANGFSFENPERLNPSKTYTFSLFNSRDPLCYGPTVFKLKFVNKKPVFTFVSVSPTPKLLTLKKSLSSHSNFNYTLDYTNLKEKATLCEIKLTENGETMEVLECLEVYKSDNFKREIAIPKSDVSIHPNLKLEVAIDGDVQISVPLIENIATDIKNHASIDAISKMIQAEIVPCIPNKGQKLEYKPNQAISRGELADILSRYAKFHLKINLEDYVIDELKGIQYKDVDKGHQYADSIHLVTSTKLMNGTDKLFKPEEALTRQEVAVFLKRLLALYLNRNMYGTLVPMDKALLKHPDASEINKYAIESMNFMVLNGFISADPFNRLNPNAIVSRADMAVIMEKMTETDLEALVW